MFNIFPNKKGKKSKSNENNSSSQKPQQKIIVDIHERNSLVTPYLHEFGADFEIKSLKTGDFIINDTIIERKTVSDFISSMISKRLVQQLLELKSYKKRALILEGQIDEKGFNPNAIRGMILSIELELGIPIIFTKDSADTAKFLLVLARKQDKDKSFSLHSKKGMTKKEVQKYIIESFPGIGPKTAEKLLKKLGTIKNIIDTPLEELLNLIGKKANVFKIIHERY